MRGHAGVEHAASVEFKTQSLRAFTAAIWAVVGMLLVGSARFGWAEDVHTNPLNREPLVREGYQHFYDLDYPGAIERFERVHTAYRADPQGSVLLLEAVLFQELYRQDLLDTTFYANDGFLSGHHATQEDPKVRDQIESLFRGDGSRIGCEAEQESGRCGCAVRARVGEGSQVHVRGDG